MHLLYINCSKPFTIIIFVDFAYFYNQWDWKVIMLNQSCLFNFLDLLIGYDNYPISVSIRWCRYSISENNFGCEYDTICIRKDSLTDLNLYNQVSNQSHMEKVKWSIKQFSDIQYFGIQNDATSEWW